MLVAHPNSTLPVLCRLMQLHLGHVTLLRAEFQRDKSPPQTNLRHRAPHIGLCPKVVVWNLRKQQGSVAGGPPEAEAFCKLIHQYWYFSKQSVQICQCQGAMSYDVWQVKIQIDNFRRGTSYMMPASTVDSVIGYLWSSSFVICPISSSIVVALQHNLCIRPKNIPALSISIHL